MRSVPPEVINAIEDAVTARAECDVSALTAALAVIVNDGPAAMFAACGTWASYIEARAIGHAAALEGADVHVGFRIEHDGEPVDPDQLPRSLRARVWALRFLTAVCNDDLDQAYALFELTQQAEEHSDYGPFELLNMAARVRLGKGDVWEIEVR